MPTITEKPITAYAHCVNARCIGNAQVEVEAVLVETAYAYHEMGGDGMFSHPERSSETPRFRNPETEGVCEHCGKNRDLSLTKRPQLDDSGYDRNALLDIEPSLRDPESYSKGGGGHVVIDDDRTSKLEQENRELREGLAELRGIMLGQQKPEPVEPLAHELPEDVPE